jgi:hypothetical protein
MSKNIIVVLMYHRHKLLDLIKYAAWSIRFQTHPYPYFSDNYITIRIIDMIIILQWLFWYPDLVTYSLKDGKKYFTGIRTYRFSTENTVTLNSTDTAPVQSNQHYSSCVARQTNAAQHLLFSCFLNLVCRQPVGLLEWGISPSDTHKQISNLTSLLVFFKIRTVG